MAHASKSKTDETVGPSIDWREDVYQTFVDTDQTCPFLYMLLVKNEKSVTVKALLLYDCVISMYLSFVGTKWKNDQNAFVVAFLMSVLSYLFL